MLSQVNSIPLQLHIPRCIPDYSSHISPLDRPRPAASQTYYSAVVSASLSSPASDSPRDTSDRTHRLPSPASPQENSTHFEIVGRSAPPFDSNICQADIYENSSSPSYSPHSQSYSSVPCASSSDFLIKSASKPRGSDTVAHYLSDSPSPIDVQQPPSLSHPSSAPPSQDRFPHSIHPLYPGPDRTITHSNSNPEQSSREDMDKYPTLHTNVFDQRRMSEPAILSGSNNLYHDASSRHHPIHYDYPKSPSSMYLTPALHRGASTGSLRDVRQQHYQYPPSNGGWKHNHSADREYGQVSPLDEPISPFQPTFNGGLPSPNGVPYSPVNDNFYGPSPPGTGTSTSSSGPLSAGLPSSLPHLSPFRSPHRSLGGPSHSPSDNTDRKNYSFIALPGNAVKKRPRRRYDEIERLYQCSWPECTKSYGTLNHLNAHVTMQKHGPKRSPAEFKELRKQWRKAKKEAEGQANLEHLRRASFSSSHDYEYDAPRFAFSNSPQRSHVVDFPSSMPSGQSFGHGQYPDTGGMGDQHYAAYHKDDHHLYYRSSQSHYEDCLPSSWQVPAPISRSVPTDFFTHPSQGVPRVVVTGSIYPHSAPDPPSPRRVINRLPPDSTLFTPLPSYECSSASVPIMEPIAFPNGNYDLGDDNSRPSTGYTSNSGSFMGGDEHDQHRV